ncbi:MAG: peptidase MA family metallohydrolase [Candidatus Omnitrophota bacterium]
MKQICKALILIVLFGAVICPMVQAKDWEMLKGDNFIVNYRSNVPEDFVKTVLDSAQESFMSVSENLGISRFQSWSGEKRAVIYIYSDQNDYIKKGGQAGWSHGASLVQAKTIKTYPSDEGFFDSLLPHELGHIILHEYVGPYANVPLWFDEGVAMYQEKAKRIGTNKIVQEALENGQFIPLSQLTDMRLYSNSDQKIVSLFYAESASIVNFMITQLGDGRFFKLCHELKENSRFVDALPKIYMHINDLNDLNRKWVDYLKDRS